MVSKASDDLPDPDRPVITTSWSRGRSTSIFLRLWTRAPRTFTQSCAMLTVQISWPDPNHHFTTHGQETNVAGTGRAGADCRQVNSCRSPIVGAVSPGVGFRAVSRAAWTRAGPR